jgi:CDGSH-type Zn-finger protein
MRVVAALVSSVDLKCGATRAKKKSNILTAKGVFAAPTLRWVQATGNFRLMRKVLKTDKRPLEIKPQQESVWICMCGLSKNQPFCDGSHKTTRDEEDGRTYEYDAEGHRHEI